MFRTVVTAVRCPLLTAPAAGSEQADELLLGWEVQLLEEAAPGWYRARSAYGYEGYAPAAALCGDPEQAAAFAARPKAVVRAPYCAVLASPSVRSRPVTEAARGALAAPLGPADGDGWVRVALPGGEEGYTKSNYLAEYYPKPALRGRELRRAAAGTALSYLGASYLWGGKSPLGIDCSGLAFMAYWLNGVAIFRDARIEPGFPVREIPRSRAQRGDLLYFPGHAAVYLGRGRYVHANARSGCVSVNSLDSSAPDYREDLARSLTAVGRVCPDLCGDA